MCPAHSKEDAIVQVVISLLVPFFLLVLVAFITTHYSHPPLQRSLAAFFSAGNPRRNTFHSKLGWMTPSTAGRRTLRWLRPLWPINQPTLRPIKPNSTQSRSSGARRRRQQQVEHHQTTPSFWYEPFSVLTSQLRCPLGKALRDGWMGGWSDGICFFMRGNRGGFWGGLGWEIVRFVRFCTFFLVFLFRFFVVLLTFL